MKDSNAELWNDEIGEDPDYFKLLDELADFLVSEQSMVDLMIYVWFSNRYFNNPRKTVDMLDKVKVLVKNCDQLLQVLPSVYVTSGGDKV